MFTLNWITSSITRLSASFKHVPARPWFRLGHFHDFDVVENELKMKKKLFQTGVQPQKKNNPADCQRVLLGHEFAPHVMFIDDSRLLGLTWSDIVHHAVFKLFNILNFVIEFVNYFDSFWRVSNYFDINWKPNK